MKPYEYNFYLLTDDEKRKQNMTRLLTDDYQISYFDKLTFNIENLKMNLISYIRQGNSLSNFLIIINDLEVFDLNNKELKYLQDLSEDIFVIFAVRPAGKISFNASLLVNSNLNELIFKKEFDFEFLSKFFQNLKTNSNLNEENFCLLAINIIEKLFDKNHIHIVKSLLSLLLIKSYGYVKIESLYKRLKISYPNLNKQKFTEIIQIFKFSFLESDPTDKAVRFLNQNFEKWMEKNYLNIKEGYQIEAIYHWSKLCDYHLRPNKSSTPSNSSNDLSLSLINDLEISQIIYDENSSLYFEKQRYNQRLHKHRHFLNKSFGYNDRNCFSKMMLIYNSTLEENLENLSSESFLSDKSITLSNNLITKHNSKFMKNNKSCFGRFFSNLFSIFKK